jgi:hypothetical protein
MRLQSSRDVHDVKAVRFLWRSFRTLNQKGQVVREHHILLDAFADARRTWDELVSLQPDVAAASGQLSEDSLIELERRVNDHRVAVEVLVDALQAEPLPELELIS